MAGWQGASRSGHEATVGRPSGAEPVEGWTMLVGAKAQASLCKGDGHFGNPGLPMGKRSPHSGHLAWSFTARDSGDPVGSLENGVQALCSSAISPSRNSRSAVHSVSLRRPILPPAKSD